MCNSRGIYCYARIFRLPLESYVGDLRVKHWEEMWYASVHPKCKLQNRN